MASARKISWRRVAPAILVLALGLLRAASADEVRVQAWEAPDYGRIVMTWGEPVGFSAVIVDRRLVARFDRPLVGGLHGVAHRLGKYVSGAVLDEGGHRLKIALKGDYRLIAVARGKVVVFDLLPEVSTARKAAAAPDRARSADRHTTARLKVRVGRHETYTRIVFDWPKVVRYRLEDRGDEISLRFERAGRIDLKRLKRRLPAGLTAPSARVEKGALVFSIRKDRRLTAEHFRVGSRVVVDFRRGAAAKTAGKTGTIAAPASALREKARRPDEPPRPATAPLSKVGVTALPERKAPPQPVPAQAAPSANTEGTNSLATAKTTGKSVGLVFDWPRTVGAAVFKRDPYVWIVFDRRAQLNLAALRRAAKSLISTIEQLPVAQGSVLRLRPLPGVSPRVQRESNNWVVTFRRWPITAQVPIRLQVRTDAVDGAEVVLPITEFGRILTVLDPEVGDRMIVATTRAPSQGVNGHRRYAEFEVLASAQGVAIVPRRDGIDLENAGSRGVAVTVAGGLHISPVGHRAGGKGFLGPRVFNFAGWRRGDAADFVAARQSAMRAIVEVPKNRRDDARLDLARFYFVRGFATEAYGVLRTIESSNRVLSSQPEFRALMGATLVSMGRHADARKDLLDPRLDKFQEIALWRGSLFLQSGEHKKAAAQFRTGDPVLAEYPDPIRTRLALERIEAGLSDQDVSGATLWLERLDKSAGQLTRKDLARLRYNRGVLARKTRDLDRAVALWGQVKKSNDRWNAARAEFALIRLGVQQETIAPAEAARRLERLRFRWRGDGLELAVLKTLGETYLDQGDYRKGLNTLRTAVTYFPNSAPVKAIAQLMAESFKALHLEGGADRLSPLKALALYDDFRELTPAGPEGDRMIQKLSDRLVTIDLLDRAADLLAHQVRYRLKGEEKARVGAKLAVIHLLDRNPKTALASLRNSFRPNLPQILEDDRRRIRAKATLELERYEEAIALLAGDVSKEADLLRADIYWKTRNYSEAAKVLQRLSGDPLTAGGYSAEQANFVLSWAVALRLKRDEAGMKLLRELYGPGMAKSEFADTFAFIASPSGGDTKEIDAMTRKIAEADRFESFLKNYRQRLIDPPARVDIPGKAGATRARKAEKAPLPPLPPSPQG